MNMRVFLGSELSIQRTQCHRNPIRKFSLVP